MTTWVDKLDARAAAASSHVCVGLDPDPKRLPTNLRDFNRAIVDATCDLVCAYKPNLAFYEALGFEGLEALRDTIDHIRSRDPEVLIVGDAKRGDIASTAEAYARACFEFWGFDVVTVSPYLGRDSVEPFLSHAGRGAFVLCRTSNAGARDLQDLRIDGAPLYHVVADHVASWDPSGRLGLVTGATYPEELAEIRAAHPDVPLLIPGIGAQGGDLAKSARAARGRMLIASSRGITYASSDPDDYPDAARQATEALRTAINTALE